MTDRWTDAPEVRDDPALQDFLQRVSAHAPTEVDPGTRVATLEAMLVEAAASHPADPSPPTWRRRVRRVFAMTGAKVVLVAGVAAAGTTGGMAATGTLPDAAQQFVHEVGQRVGIGVPDAPGQAKEAGEPARDLAPGQLKQEAEAEDARDFAPGQQRDGDTPGRSGEAPVKAGHDDTPDTTDAGDDPVADPAEEPAGGSDDAPGRTGEIPSQDPDQAPADPDAQDTGEATTDGEGRSEDTPAPDGEDAANGRSDDAPGRSRGDGPATGRRQAPDTAG